MTKQHLPNYLRTHRKRAHLAQHQVARLMGAHSGSKVSRYESFSRVPDLVTVFALEIIYGIPARELFAGIFDEARRLVKEQASQAMKANDTALAAFVHRILDPSGGRPTETHKPAHE